MPPANPNLTLHIRCHNLPGACFEERTAVRLGIQKRTEAVHDVPADVVEVTFTAAIGVTRAADGRADFRGPCVHGRPGERFLYLTWGELREGAWDMFRRAKIPLRGLPEDLVDEALRTGRALETRLDMTDAKGGPLCASVREERIRWTLADAGG